MQSKYFIKKGHRGDLVFLIQEEVQSHNSSNYALVIDGVFNQQTENALKAYQKSKKLKPDGICGALTWLAMGLSPDELESDTDAINSATWIEQYNLPEGEYVKEISPKSWIFIASNNGQHSPYRVIDTWANDQRGRIGAHYVIGGLPTNIDKDIEVDENDGKILQAIKDEYRGYHLGKVKSTKMIKGSISIELCSAGHLTEENGKYFTWYNQEVHPSQVVRLDQPYRGHRYFHKYSQKQLDALKALLLLLTEKHNIESSVDYLTSDTYFNPSRGLVNSKQHGIFTRDMVNPKSINISPQKELLDILTDF
jgi:hypothetical protein|tara:strand:- start:412 stop:1338 length:927 start_codon:yes stop_codon:yes gene_type:complete